MKKGLLIAPVILGLSLWLIFSKDTDHSPESTLAPKVSSSTPVVMKDAVTVDFDSPSQTATKPKTPKASDQRPMDLPVDPQFELYTELSRKALRTEEENERMQRIIRDEKLISNLGALLQTEYLTHEPLQFAALDVVFEALKIGSLEAHKHLQNIVADGFIENPNNEFSQRQAQAELKAEVLYRWLASSPELENEMRSALPGEVSKRLWENVKRAHENNIMESDQST
jgi:hypothetical protein